MKLAGLWLALFGYTMLYVGLQNLNGNTISFVGALTGQSPTADNPSAGTSLSSYIKNGGKAASGPATVQVSSAASNSGGIQSLINQANASGNVINV